MEEENEKIKSNNYKGGKISFICGIVTLLTIFVANGFTATIGIISGIISIVFGILSIKKSKSKLGIAGLVISIIGIIILILMATVTLYLTYNLIYSSNTIMKKNTANNLNNSLGTTNYYSTNSTSTQTDEDIRQKKLFIKNGLEIAVSTAMGENEEITDGESLKNYIDAAFSAVELKGKYTITGDEIFGWTVLVEDVGTWEITPLGLIIESR